MRVRAMEALARWCCMMLSFLSQRQDFRLSQLERVQTSLGGTLSPLHTSVQAEGFVASRLEFKVQVGCGWDVTDR